MYARSAPSNHISDGCGTAQEYYANTGALKNAAETAQGGKKVGCSIVETFSKSTKPRELEEVLRLEYRSKLLNPKWAQVRCIDQFLTRVCFSISVQARKQHKGLALRTVLTEAPDNVLCAPVGPLGCTGWTLHFSAPCPGLKDIGWHGECCNNFTKESLKVRMYAALAPPQNVGAGRAHGTADAYPPNGGPCH